MPVNQEEKEFSREYPKSMYRGTADKHEHIVVANEEEEDDAPKGFIDGTKFWQQVEADRKHAKIQAKKDKAASEKADAK